MNPNDPFVVTSKEKIRFEQQFNALQPQLSFVTGSQAKKFLLKSGLSPLVLGQIWALADTDADGKMNLIEFSIACKLISLKLRNVEVPKQLPPTLIASLQHTGAPIRTPTGSLSPVEGYKTLITSISSQSVPMQSFSMIPQQQAPQNYQIPSSEMNLPSEVPKVLPLVSSQPPLLLESLTQNPPAGNVVLPAGPTPPQSGQASRSMSFSMDKPPSIELPTGLEWSIPQSSKLKYTQMFNTADKTKIGFLTGSQARSILLQTKVPQGTLAQIWSLSDMDADGRLGCEEFVLALYLCELCMTGKTVPVVLPPELIPPSFRKPTSRHGSAINSRHGSVSSQGAVVGDLDINGINQTTFEDKRKENFDKGQAELERRRKVLADIQKKEQDERERKEREESEKREKARLEAEQKKQQEIGQEIQRQKELEQEREDQRKRELDKKEQARKELEKQRQSEWEAQKLQEMEQERQMSQERLLKLKGQNQTLTIDLGTLDSKVKELSQKICDTRVGVTNVKSIIDGMRTTRDTQMSEMTSLKARIKEQNQRLVQLSQEKVKMIKTNHSADDQAMFANKQLVISQLRSKLTDLSSVIETKEMDINNNKEQQNAMKTILSNLITHCEELYNDYDVSRIQVLEMKNNQKNETFSSAWDNNSSSAWPAQEEAQVEVAAAVAEVESAPAPAGYIKYRAIFEFEARNSDELSLQPGDIVMVSLQQNAEPGWLAGEIGGYTGWFPDTYVEKFDLDGEVTEEIVAEVVQSRKLEGIEEIPETVPVAVVVPIAVQNGEPTAVEEVGEIYVSCYPYQSSESGDLIFDVGEVIRVIKKEGDWWTGVINTNTGIFPANYVQLPSDITSVPDNNPIEYSNGNGEVMQNEERIESTMAMSAEEERNQADADSEVSQINTQTPTNDTANQDFRSMSSMSSATPSLRKKGEVAQVIAPYEGTSSEQLSLQRGQLIMIRKKTDSGWWEGELQAKGRRRQVGWFPATYVKVLAGGRNSGRNTPVSASKIDLHEMILDKVQAMYPYKALNDDELSFEADDIISVLGRDEPEWWRGELNGISGLFPSNYVRTFVSSGNI
ncbi:unnamed protein product [Diamesa tonsa]